MNRFRFGLILCAVCNGSLLCAADLKGTDQPAVDAAAVAQVEKSLAATTQIRTEGELPLEDILSQFVREQNVPIRVDGASFHSQAIDMDHVPPLDFRGLIVREALQKLIRALAHKKQDFNPLITEASGLLYISANGQSKLNLETTAMWDKNIAYKQFTGTVVNADGSPAGGAVVQIWGGQQTFLPTNAEGQFRTPTNALVEQFTFLASDESGKQLGAWRVPSPDWRNPLRELPKIVITLRPAKPVIVEVVDRNNAPIKDAHVTITLARSRHIRLQTDVAGKVAYRYPAELSLNSVVALKAGDGLDYVSFEESTTPNETAKETPVGPTSDVRLKLEGATPIKVIVKDEDGNAAMGVQIYVERLSKQIGRAHV